MVNMYKKGNRKNVGSLFCEKSCAFFMITGRRNREKIRGFEQKNFCNIFEKNMKNIKGKKMKTKVRRNKKSEKSEKTERKKIKLHK